MYAPRDLAETLHAIRLGERDIEDEVSLALERIERCEETIHALIPDETTVQRKKRLLSEARHLHQRWPDPDKRPPLYGAIVGVKDLFHTRGFPVRAGSRLPGDLFIQPGAPGLPHTGANTDADTVARLREAGALILGKTHSTEFAYFAPAPTRNPIDPTVSPGGSSSGSAAAVGAGYCQVALGTQTIGSISRPASFCGVCGYKPSYGRISADGVVPFSPSADHIGYIAASVSAVSALAPVLVEDWDSVLAAETPRVPDYAVSAAPLQTAEALRPILGTVLVPDDEYLAQADEHSKAALDAVCERLLGMGIDVQRLELFPDIEEINGMHQDMIAFDFAGVHSLWFDEYRDSYHERSAELVHRGRAITEERFRQAQTARLTVRARLDSALSRHGASLFIAPATVGEAPEGIETTGSPIMNLPWTYSGLPTISLPLTGIQSGRGPRGLPLGVQLATTFGNDERLIGLSLAMERALDSA